MKSQIMLLVVVNRSSFLNGGRFRIQYGEQFYQATLSYSPETIAVVTVTGQTNFDMKSVNPQTINGKFCH
jgi:hypothetical protein